MGKIEIPKAIFEKIFFEDGGEKRLTKSLTGDFQFGLDKENPVTNPNAIVEDKEFIKDSEGTRQVLGDTHEQGGEPVVLEENSKVLSDNLKVGKLTARDINAEYDVKVKATDTYATALEKIRDSIGLTKLIKEQEDLIKKVDEQQKETKDENTLSANLEILSAKINDNQAEKESLEPLFEGAFQKLFEKQEASKPKEESEEAVYADGGTHKTPKWRIPNAYENSEYYTKQSLIDPKENEIYGDKIEKQKAIEENKRLFPTLSAVYFQDGLNRPNDTGAFQQDINTYYSGLLDSAKEMYGEGSTFYKELKNQIEQDKFVDEEGNVRSKDKKFGNWTSTRPNYSFPLLPKDVYEEVSKSGVNTAGQLKEKFPEYYKEYVEKAGTLHNDAWLSEKEETPTAESGDTASPEVNEDSGKVEKVEVDRMGVLNMPDQRPLTPTALQSHLKTNRRYERMDFTEVSPEAQLSELNKLTERAENNLSMMPASQRAAVSANLLATQADQTSKILSQTEQYNKQGYDRIQNINAQINDREEDAGASDALNFEQRQMLAEAKTRKDYETFYNTLARNNMANYNTINNLNLSNALYDNFKFTDRGVELLGDTKFTAPTPKLTGDIKLDSSLLYLAKEQEEYNKRVQAEAEKRHKLKNKK